MNEELKQERELYVRGQIHDLYIFFAKSILTLNPIIFGGALTIVKLNTESVEHICVLVAGSVFLFLSIFSVFIACIAGIKLYDRFFEILPKNNDDVTEMWENISAHLLLFSFTTLIFGIFFTGLLLLLNIIN
tara:strand:+ start:124 stop:519 length:396 start_codon:yes stop_codon:yes gene_type:complete